MRSKKGRTERTVNGTGTLVGIGMDHDDGHKRITKGPGIVVLGGSKETHEKLTEKAMKFSEEAARRGKDIRDLSPREAKDIGDKIFS